MTARSLPHGPFMAGDTPGAVYTPGAMYKIHATTWGPHGAMELQSWRLCAAPVSKYTNSTKKLLQTEF